MSDTLEKTAKLAGYSNLGRYQARANFLFDGTGIRGRRVLDVGAGRGAWSLWAAQQGAARVVAIEPETDGSSNGTLKKLRESVWTLGLGDRIRAYSDTLHTVPEGGFDVAVLYNVINHLDERNVQLLHINSAAVDLYAEMLRKDLASRIAPGGWVIIADSMRANFWNLLGLESPLARGIEWDKHQNPGVWKEVFQKAGLDFVDLRWSPLYPLGRLTGNRLVQFLTASHFVLRFRKPIPIPQESSKVAVGRCA